MPSLFLLQLAASRMRRSRTFVPVGPVAITSPSATKNEYESLRRRKSSTSSPIAVARSMVVLSTIAPAAGLLPSMPSVPAQSATVLDTFRDRVRRKAVSRFRPPMPLPRTGHANSPPEIKQATSLLPLCFARSASKRLMSRSQPSSIGRSQTSEAISVMKSRCRATFAAACYASELLSSTRYSRIASETGFNG